MLLDGFNKQGLLTVTSVLGRTAATGISAFRGDLVLIEGALREGSDTDRKPPELVMRHAALLAGSDKLLFVGGLLYELEHLPVFMEKYATALAPETVALFLVENIAAVMQVTYGGFNFTLAPYKNGLVWNELLDLLYIEKADLKGQSAEDKIVTVYEAAKSYIGKAPVVAYDEALTKTIEVKKEAAVGPV